jgi:hypothetical protein
MLSVTVVRISSLPYEMLSLELHDIHASEQPGRQQARFMWPLSWCTGSLRRDEDIPRKYRI